MESFFATLKAEPPQTVFPRLAAPPRAVFDHIERFYDRQRRHSTFAYLSPLAYEQWYGAQRDDHLSMKTAQVHLPLSRPPPAGGRNQAKACLRRVENFP